MTVADALKQLKSLREQLDQLETALRAPNGTNGAQPHTFADLRGILRGANTSDEEIRSARYQSKPFPNDQ